MIYKIPLVSTLLFICFTAAAAPNTLNFQAFIRKPDGLALQESSVNFRVKYKNPGNSCTVYIEDFLGVSMAGSNGNVSLQLGAGSQIFPATNTGITLFQTFSNSSPPAPLNCAEGGAPYSPAATDRRIMSVEFVYTGVSSQKLDNIEINSVPFSMYSTESQNAEKLAGVAASLYTQFSNFTTCTSGKFLTYDGNGNTFTCETPASTNFSGNLAGDITGTQNATVVSSLRGTPLSATAPTSGQYLKFDGTNWVPQTLSLTNGTVTSVSSANSYLSIASASSTPVFTLNVGTAAGTVAAGDDSRILGAFQSATTLSGDLSGTLPGAIVATVGAKTASQIATSVTDTTNATNAATASTLVKRDSSGNASFSTASASNFSGRNFLFYEPTDTYKVSLAAPAALATNYTLTLPTTAGTSGYVLSTNGAGATSWIAASTGSVTGVSGTAPVSVTGTTTPVVSMAAANGSTDGYLTSANWTTFNNKLSTGTTFSGDVSGAYNTMSVDKIKGTAVTIASLTSGNFLNYNGTNWVNATPAISDITNLSTTLSNKLDQSQMPAACSDSETLTFFSPTGTWNCYSIKIDAIQITSGTIRADLLFTEATFYNDGQSELRAGDVLDIGNEGRYIVYDDLDLQHQGIVRLPDTAVLPQGWQIKIMRKTGTNLVIMTANGEFLRGESDTLDMKAQNLASVTLVNVSKPPDSKWMIQNEVQDCYLGKPCGASKNIYIGNLNGFQYFTTPGACDSGARTCDGGEDFETTSWAENTGGNPAYGVPTGFNSTNDGQLQAANLSHDYTDTSAAKACGRFDFSENGLTIDGWYLPTIAEFDLLLQNKASLDSFISKFDVGNKYWTSAESDAFEAILYNQSVFNYQPRSKSDLAKYRCVRRW